MRRWVANHVFPAQARLGEGPVWDMPRAAYWWIDITARRIHRWRPTAGPSQEGHQVWELDQMPGALALRPDGRCVVAAEKGFFTFDPQVGTLLPVYDPEPDQPLNRFNDGKCDPWGRFWAGTMRIEDALDVAAGHLYMLDTSRTCHKLTETPLGLSNGMAWTSDGSRMYFIDSAVRQVKCLPLSAGGPDRPAMPILPGSIEVTTPESWGLPDGMTIDEHDRLWIAFWGGSRVAQYCPREKAWLAEVAVPASHVTSCTFGGPHLDALLITTAREGLTEQQARREPLAGDLFVARVGVSGRLPMRYEG